MAESSKRVRSKSPKSKQRQKNLLAFFEEYGWGFVQTFGKLDLDPTVGAPYKYTDGTEKPIDVQDGERAHREYSFRTLLPTLGVLPTRENWPWNKRNEAFMDNVRHAYEHSLILMHIDLQMMPFEYCKLMWKEMRDQEKTPPKEVIGSRTIKKYREYHKEFPIVNDANAQERQDWWSDYWEMQEYGSTCSARLEDERPPKVWSYRSAEEFGECDDDRSMKDWIAVMDPMPMPGATGLIPCLMQYEPPRRTTKEPQKAAGKKQMARRNRDPPQ